jgi:hypothetical protein
MLAGHVPDSRRTLTADNFVSEHPLLGSGSFHIARNRLIVYATQVATFSLLQTSSGPDVIIDGQRYRSFGLTCSIWL